MLLFKIQVSTRKGIVILIYSIRKKYANLFDPPAFPGAIFPTTPARLVVADLAIVDSQGQRGEGL